MFLFKNEQQSAFPEDFYLSSVWECGNEDQNSEFVICQKQRKILWFCGLDSRVFCSTEQDSSTIFFSWGREGPHWSCTVCSVYCKQQQTECWWWSTWIVPHSSVGPAHRHLLVLLLRVLQLFIKPLQKVPCVLILHSVQFLVSSWSELILPCSRVGSEGGILISSWVPDLFILIVVSPINRICTRNYSHIVIINAFIEVIWLLRMDALIGWICGCSVHAWELRVTGPLVCVWTRWCGLLLLLLLRLPAWKENKGNKIVLFICEMRRKSGCNWSEESTWDEMDIAMRVWTKKDSGLSESEIFAPWISSWIPLLVRFTSAQGSSGLLISWNTQQSCSTGFVSTKRTQLEGKPVRKTFAGSKGQRQRMIYVLLTSVCEVELPRQRWWSGEPRPVWRARRRARREPSPSLEVNTLVLKNSWWGANECGWSNWQIVLKGSQSVNDVVWSRHFFFFDQTLTWSNEKKVWIGQAQIRWVRERAYFEL